MKIYLSLQETLEWYYLDQSNPSQHETKGPISERDLDVLWRTSTLFSTTMLWKDGMTNWKALADLPELREKLLGNRINFPLIIETKKIPR